MFADIQDEWMLSLGANERVAVRPRDQAGHGAALCVQVRRLRGWCSPGLVVR